MDKTELSFDDERDEDEVMHAYKSSKFDHEMIVSSFFAVITLALSAFALFAPETYHDVFFSGSYGIMEWHLVTCTAPAPLFLAVKGILTYRKSSPYFRYQFLVNLVSVLAPLFFLTFDNSYYNSNAHGGSLVITAVVLVFLAAFVFELFNSTRYDAKSRTSSPADTHEKYWIWLLTLDWLACCVFGLLAVIATRSWLDIAHYMGPVITEEQVYYQQVTGWFLLGISLGAYQTLQDITSDSLTTAVKQRSLMMFYVAFMVSFFFCGVVNILAHTPWFPVPVKPIHWLAPLGVPPYMAVHAYLYYKKH